jgi:DNA excision repair protein ERCC-4
MVIPLDSDGRAIVDAEDFFWENTYNAGGQLIPRPELSVLVDLREFRSSLPFLLHSFHMKVIPCTLEVGDYILSPDICVERKSVSDLAQSLKSGRLYNQCQAMASNYLIFVLLIEFEEGRSFRIRSRFDITDISSGLTLLLVHFPKLKVIWSASSAQTAKIFKDLKKERNEPNLEKAISIGSDTATSQYNIIPSEILKSFPGVTFQNQQTIMKNVKNIKELSEMTLASLSKLIGNDNAKLLFDFIRKKQVIS